MTYIVNSSPRAGYKYEPSSSFITAAEALLFAAALTRRGMRLVRIVDTESGKVYEESVLRRELKEGPAP